jgi:hypothetical protein
MSHIKPVVVEIFQEISLEASNNSLATQKNTHVVNVDV